MASDRRERSHPEIGQKTGQNFYDRLVAAGKARKLALTAMRKLTVILNAILRDATPWHAPIQLESPSQSLTPFLFVFPDTVFPALSTLMLAPRARKEP